MKILLCAPAPLSKEYGSSKTLIELSEELQKLGCACKVISPADVLDDGESFQSHYTKKLRYYLCKYAHEYDIVEYDSCYLPYWRKEFCSKTLFVARSQMLVHHFKNIAIPLTVGGVPLKKDWKSNLRYLVLGSFYKIQLQQRIQQTTITVNEADLVIISNNDDKAELLKCGICEEKMCVIPNGISPSRRKLFNGISATPPLAPKVAFVGTFDNRKGSTDFPAIVQYVCNEIPNVSFRLLGTSGLYKTQQEVLEQFPIALREKIEVIPKFKPEDLPEFLSACSVGVFPSYLEAFPHGVLEMLTASVPVIAYNAPGAPMMLTSEYLVSRGDTKGMSEKVISLLKNAANLTAARLWAKQQSQQFCWQQIAQQTGQVYLEFWQKKQEK